LKQEHTVNWRIPVIAVSSLTLAGCSAMYPPENVSVRDNIQAELNRATAERAPTEEKRSAPASGLSPEQLNQLLMPSIDSLTPRITTKTVQQRFDLSVTDAPISQVLAGLVEGTEYSMLIKPGVRLAGPGQAGSAAAVSSDAADKRVTLNLKNITLFEALDSIRDLYGFDYSVNGTRILVEPANIQTRLYQVNYVLGQRRGVSDIQVVGGTSGQAGAGGSGQAGSNYSSIQASGLSTTVKSDIWSEVEDALRTVLGCTIPRSAATSTAATSQSAGGGSRADTSHPGNLNISERARGVDGCTEGRALNTNQMSGTILVRAMPQELRMVEQVLKAMQLSISRQVIIEAKIIDVTLSKAAQQGINWAAFRNGYPRFSVGADPNQIASNVLRPIPGTTLSNSSSLRNIGPSSSTSNELTGTSATDILGATSSTLRQSTGTSSTSGSQSLASETAFSSTTAAVSGVTLGALLGSGTSLTGAGSAFNLGLGVAIQASNFAALIDFLETQGTVNVLSSPRITTLNNQKAVIKVGSEEPFVTNIVAGSTQTASGSVPVITPPSLVYQPFFSGIALDVTPQIDDNDNITLHVHSMVNSIVERPKIALPSQQSALVPFASNTINETDSVVKAQDGQVIVIGGLMTEGTADNRGGIPGVREVPGLGGLFNKGAQSSIKRELVILLRPTVVKDDTTWANEISAVGGRISSISSPPRAPATP
jgi:MSHA biogenesis protein MshL